MRFLKRDRHGPSSKFSEKSFEKKYFFLLYSASLLIGLDFPAWLIGCKIYKYLSFQEKKWVLKI
jgi:hypothetical protein